MVRVKIGQLKNQLSRYLDLVRGGDEVLVLDRDRPVARIVPLDITVPREGADAARVDRLERGGLIRKGGGRHPAWLGTRAPVRISGGLLAELLSDREQGW